MSRENQLSQEAKELFLFAINTSSLYETRSVPICRNLAKFLAKGEYKANKAINAWKPVADDAAKAYAKEFANRADWNRIFSVEDRNQCARSLAVYYEEHIERFAKEFTMAECKIPESERFRNQS
ncbi:hypothetical protein ACI2KR_27415 [Pseudomonas luteola]